MKKQSKQQGGSVLADKPKRPIGRPKQPFDVERGNRVCEAIANGETLRSIAAREGINNSTIFSWQRWDEEFAKQYAQAMADRADNDFEKLADMMEAEPERGKFGIDNGWANWQKTRIDTLKWIVCHRLPKKYSDRLQLAGDDETPVKLVVEYVGSERDAKHK